MVQLNLYHVSLTKLDGNRHWTRSIRWNRFLLLVHTSHWIFLFHNPVDRKYVDSLRVYITHAQDVRIYLPSVSAISHQTPITIRIALWERRVSIIIVLGVLCIAHWALLYRTMFIVVSEWEASSKACVVVQTNPSMLNTTFFFSKLTSIYYSSHIFEYWHDTSASYGLWFYYPYLHCNRPPLPAFSQNRSLEASFSGRTCVFSCFILNELRPSSKYSSVIYVTCAIFSDWFEQVLNILNLNSKTSQIQIQIMSSFTYSFDFEAPMNMWVFLCFSVTIVWLLYPSQCWHGKSETDSVDYT